MRVLPNLASLSSLRTDRLRPNGGTVAGQVGERGDRLCDAPDLDGPHEVNYGIGMLLALCLWAAIIAGCYALFDLVPGADPP